MNNKIISLSKILLKDTIQNLKIFSRKKNKRLSNSNSFWMIIILVIAITLLSYKAIKVFAQINQPQIFLNLYFLIIAIFLQLQIILTTLNALFFTKDLEYILPLPLTQVEILSAKYIVVTAMAYMTELIFALIPMIIYGTITHISMLYFILMPIVLLIFPLLFVTITSVLAIILVNIFKFIKNKNTCQLLVGTILICIILTLEIALMNTYNDEVLSKAKAGDYEITEQNMQEAIESAYKSIVSGYIVVNPTVEILAKPNSIGIVFSNLSKLIIYNVIPLIFLMLIGKRMYLKTILGNQSISNSPGTKKPKKIAKTSTSQKTNLQIDVPTKQKTIAKAYIEKDIKLLLRNSTFFMQLIFPIVTVFLVILIGANGIVTALEKSMLETGELRNQIASIPFSPKTASIILCIIEILCSIPAISLSAISREGKNAIFMKYAPISFYKQFLYKNAIQLIVNFITTMTVVIMTYMWISDISLLYAVLLAITATLISLINSYVMLIIDIKKPQLNWVSEYEITKNNKNKIFQYVFMILMVFLLLYISKILSEMNITTVLLIQIGIFAILFGLLDFWVRSKKSFNDF